MSAPPLLRRLACREAFAISIQLRPLREMNEPARSERRIWTGQCGRRNGGVP